MPPRVAAVPSFAGMKATKTVKKLVGKARATPIARAAEKRATKTLRTLDALAEKSRATRVAKKAVKDVAKNLDVVTAKRELKKVSEPAPAQQKMPKTIRTTGGKRLPGKIAAKAVRRGANDFKPKKGKRN